MIGSSGDWSVYWFLFLLVRFLVGSFVQMIRTLAVSVDLKFFNCSKLYFADRPIIYIYRTANEIFVLQIISRRGSASLRSQSRNIVHESMSLT